MSKQKGQSVVIVFFLLTLALGVGVGVASRFIKNLRSTVEVDYSARSIAVAEAGVERMLTYTYDELSDFINFGNCGADCLIQYTGSDGVLAQSQVTLSFMGATPNEYAVDVSTTNTIEIDLESYPGDTPLFVCWDNPPTGDYPSITGLYFYGSTGSYNVDSYAYNSVASSHSENGFDTASANLGYQNCFTVAGQATPESLRLKSVYNDVTVFIVPDAGNSLPSQGIIIESVGTVGGTTRQVEVIRTKPNAPAQFDYIIYSRSATDPLAN